MKLTEKDLQYIVTESVKRIIKEFNYLLYGNDEPDYSYSHGTLKLDDYDLFYLVDSIDSSFQSLDDDFLNNEFDKLKDEYTIYFNGYSEITYDDGLYEDINKIDYEPLKNALYKVYDELPQHPNIKWTD